MGSFGYDLVVLMDEAVINKALAAVFYTGRLKKRGIYSYVKGMDKDLQCFTEVGYLIRLKNEPLIDLRGYNQQTDKGKVGIQLSLETFLTVLTGVDVELDVACGAIVDVAYDHLTESIVYDLSEVSLYDFRVNAAYQCQKNVLKRLGEISKILIAHYLKEDVRVIHLPLDLVKLHLPKMPDAATGNLPFSLMAVKIFDQKAMAIALNFFDHHTGNLEGLTGMTTSASLDIAMKTDCLSEIAGFWWENTNAEKSKSFEGNMVVNLQRYLLQGAELLARAITLGFLQPTTTVTHGELDYQMEVELLELPKFTFGNGQLLGLEDLKLKVTLEAQLVVEGHHALALDTSGLIPDQLTPWQDDMTIGKLPFKKKLFNLNEVLDVTVQKVQCSLQLDHENRLVLKVVEALLSLELGDHWYQNLTDGLANGFLDILEKNVIDKIPAIVVSPALLLADTEVMGYSFGVKPYELNVNADYIRITTDLIVNELAPHSVPMPLYIGNSKSKRLHRFDCAVVKGIDFTHRLGYHCVSDGLLEGYVPCGECLKGYEVGVVK